MVGAQDARGAQDGNVDLPISKWQAKSVKAHRRKVFVVGWNAEGKRLASGSVDQTVRVSRVDEHCAFRQECELRGHQDGVTNLAWHPSHNERLASIAQPEKSVRFWDTRAAKNTATLPTPGPNLYLAWSHDGNVLAVGNKDDLVCLVDTRKMKITAKHQHKYQVNEMAFSRGGDLFYQASGLGQGEVEVFSWPELGKKAALRGHTAHVLSLALDPAGKYIATGGADALACLWDARDYVCLASYYRMDYAIRSLSFSHDSRYLAIAGEQAAIDVEDVASGASLGRLPLRVSPECCAWNPAHHVLAFAGEHGRDGSGSEFGSIEFRWRLPGAGA